MDRVSRRLRRDRGAQPEESAGVVNPGRQLLPAALQLIRAKTSAAGNLRRPWFLFEAYAELRTMVRVYLDPRYRTTWAARIAPPALLALIITSWYWLPGTFILWTPIMVVVDKAVDVLLAFVAFKILHREARRYRELVGDLPALPSSES